ncbi:MAG: DEAD/DEAH box helicase [Magnetococcales bacterium]|nr:DEAD/DEAH box helicase [Magnetococcales bacterium]
MGLGKTPQTIVACDMLIAESVLVLAPAVARINWAREFQRFQSIRRRVTVIDSSSNKLPRNGVVICSYDLASQPEILDLLMLRRPDVLILDECHFLKCHRTQRTQAVFGPKCDRVGGLAEGARHVFALSGTPAPNHPAELWPLLQALFPEAITRNGQVMSYRTFLERFCRFRENQHGVRVTGGRNLQELRSRLAPHMLRRRKEEVLSDLPPIRFETVVLPADGSLTELWQAEDELEGAAIKAVLKEGGDLSQEAIHLAKLRRLTGLAKVQPVVELLRNDLDGGMDKVVVFAHHREVIQGLVDGLSGYGVVVLQGSTSPAQRQIAIDGFQNNPAVRIFIGQLTAAGTAITLTAASNVLFAESSWTPADNLQAAMRVHRIGQRHGVLVRFATLAGSLDEAITRTVRRKTEILSQLFD